MLKWVQSEELYSRTQLTTLTGNITVRCLCYRDGSAVAEIALKIIFVWVSVFDRDRLRVEEPPDWTDFFALEIN